ncbi:MAG: T9SS type A sorting domain-containing protein [Bacteroidota bacterium]
MGTGGGGGFSGGGGGNGGTTSLGNPTGGGGGSYNGGINQVNTSSVNAGHGYVVVTRLSGVNLTQIGIINCYGQLSGALTASASGGTGPYTYSWSPGGSTSTSLTGLGPGTYTCRATDAASVVYVSTFVITQPAQLTSSITAQINNICSGGITGAATIVASGGTAPYSYTWSPGGGFSASAGNLPTGIYTVNIKDMNNCSTSSTVSINQPSPINIVAFAINSTVCAGNTTTLIAGGALTYSWSGGVSNGLGFTPPASAVYSVLGTDASGCTGSNTVYVTVNPSPSISVSGPNSVCSGSVVSLSVSGANSYSWSTGSNASSILVAPTSSSSYTAYGFNTFGCSASLVKNISVLSLPSVSASISSNSICAGYPVVAFATGANTYNWSGGVANGVAFSPSVTSTYTLIGTDLNGCSNYFITTVSIIPSPAISISGNTLVCPGNNVSLSASGANSYTWSTGSTGTSISVSPSATAVYSIIGVNASGCTSNAFKTIVVSALPTVSITTTNTSVCDGVPVTLVAVGGASSYTWLPMNVNPLYITVTPSINTTYTLLASNAAGCSNSTSILIGVNAAPNISVSSPTAICSGATLNMSASGAVSYTWNTGATTANVVLNPTASAVYTVVGKGSNGCLKTTYQSVVLDPLPIVGASSTSSVLCLGSQVSLIGSGATTYTWLPMNIVGAFVNVSPTNNSTYTVTGKNNSGCTNTAVVAVTVNPLPVLSVSGAGNLCAGNSSTLVVSGANTYTWSNSINAASLVVSPAISNTFVVSGTTANGCVGSANAAVNVLSLPNLSVIGTTSVCAGSQANLVASGANNYVWSIGGSTSSVSIHPTVTTAYILTGTAANGCTSVISGSIIVEALPNVVAVSSSPQVCSGTGVTLIGSGANTYTWLPINSNAALSSINPTVSTTYTLIGKTLSACSNSAILSVSVMQSPVLSIIGNTNICNGQTATLTASGANTYTWNNTTNAAIINVLPASTSTYVVYGSTAAACIGSANILVNVSSLPVLSISGNTAVCAGSSATLLAGGASTYTWSTSSNNASVTINPTATGVYSLNGTNANNCSAGASVMVIVNALPSITINASKTTICKGESLELRANGGTNYLWSEGSQVNAIYVSPTVNATYTVSGQGANNCSNSAVINVTVSECTGLNAFTLQPTSLLIYPNPSAGTFKINVYEALDLILVSSLGECIQKIHLDEQNHFEMQVTELAKGVYFVIGNNGGKNIKQKVIIQ